jgi:asparagine synthase (glutamine-hydrolysing)
MCGIAGILPLGPDGAAPPDGVIDAMTATMTHRGPDGCTAFVGPSVALGHRRLSIIDLTDAASQPMFNEDRTLALVFNGEIYNFRQLRRQLESRGHRFRSQTDGEVILHLYEECGTACAAQLEGMFAFAVYDFTAHEVYLARDRVGEKPLFFTVSNGVFYFCSEIKGLLAVPGVSRRLSPRGVNACLNFVQIPAPITIIEGIEKLPPAHWMRIGREGAREVRPYWTLDYTVKRSVSDEQATDQLHTLMLETMEKMLVSDVPVGLLLSGGVDSTLLLALAKELGVRDLQTFTVGNTSTGIVDEECSRAGKMARQFGVANTVFDFGRADFGELRTAAAGASEPIGLLELFYQCGVFRQLRQHVKVVLTGNGADEIFGGYSTYTPIARLSHAFAWTSPFVAFTNPLVNDLAAAFYVQRNGRTVTKYLKGEAGQWSGASARLLTAAMRQAKYDTLLDAKLFADLSVLCNHSLSSIPDTSGMLNSVEVRSPFLHHSVIEFAAALPAGMKIANGSGPIGNKAIVKRLLTRYVDHDDVYVRKYGFGFFLNAFDLMRTKWKADMERLLWDQAVMDLDMFNRAAIADAWSRLQTGELQFRERLIFARYVMFALWYRDSELAA